MNEFNSQDLANTAWALLLGNGRRVEWNVSEHRVGFLRSLSVFGFCLGLLVFLISLVPGFPSGFLWSLLVLGSLCSSRFLPVPRVFLVFRSFLGSLVLWFLRFFGLPGSSFSSGFYSSLWVHSDLF